MISKQEVYIGDFREKALKLKQTYGMTDRFSTDIWQLDKYISGQDPRFGNRGNAGGFGRRDGYEIVTLFGPTGIGKSLVALNFIAPAIKADEKVGLLILEDDMADASVRLSFILGETEWQAMNERRNVRCLPEDALVRSWSLEDLLKYIEDWFDEGIDLILLDHLQFAFEGAESLKGENEYTAQRVFMQKLNQLMKKKKKTIILVNHVNKDGTAKGMNKIQGSGSIAQAGTKVIEVNKDKDNGDTVLRLWKSRFTATPDHSYHLRIKNSRLEPLN